MGEVCSTRKVAKRKVFGEGTHPPRCFWQSMSPRFGPQGQLLLLGLRDMDTSVTLIGRRSFAEPGAAVTVAVFHQWSTHMCGEVRLARVGHQLGTPDGCCQAFFAQPFSPCCTMQPPQGGVAGSQSHQADCLQELFFPFGPATNHGNH